MGSEQREAIRVPLDVEIDIQSDSTFYAGFTGNISQGGLFVATHTPSKIGERVTVKFKLPNSAQELELVGVVRWLREHNPLQPDMYPGMGVQFVDPSPEAVKIIEEFIRRVREPMFMPEED